MFANERGASRRPFFLPSLTQRFPPTVGLLKLVAMMLGCLEGSMKLWIWLTAGCAISAVSGLAMAQPSASDEAGNWVLEPSTARCVSSRQYGSPEAPVTLGFKASPLGDAVQAVIVRPGQRSRVGQAEARITIDGEIVRGTALTYPLDARRSRMVHLINLSGEHAAALRRAQEIRVWVKIQINASREALNRRFALGPMANAWTELDACLRRLRQTWNIGETGGKLASPAELLTPTTAVFTDRDYPRVALRKEQTGSTQIILLIDETGAVKDCTLAETSGAAVLDASTCGIILRRARFRPATDVNGKPVKSAYEQRITWALK